MIRLENTEYEHEIPTKYFRAKVYDKRKTEMEHLLIACVDVDKVKVIDGTVIVESKSPNGNFIIPKRRFRIFAEAERNLKFNGVYIFKLQEESRSKKYMVSEIFLCEV